jgi:hypothetical protein
MVWINKDIENEHGWAMREQRCLVYHPEQEKDGSVKSSRGVTGKTLIISVLIAFTYTICSN